MREITVFVHGEATVTGHHKATKQQVCRLPDWPKCPAPSNHVGIKGFGPPQQTLGRYGARMNIRCQSNYDEEQTAPPDEQTHSDLPSSSFIG
jgi:hypothetical protein